MVLPPTFRSPKLAAGSNGGSQWYRYYAGYSADFVADVLDWTARTAREGLVLDPWNGAGTTTMVAWERGIRSVGFDANPALVVVAKARNLGPEVTGSLDSLLDEIIARADELRTCCIDSDPLSDWFYGESASMIRAIERSIFNVLVSRQVDCYLADIDYALDVSSLAAYYYVVLFETVRGLLRPMVSSNPTWLKRPTSQARLRPTTRTIETALRTIQGQLKSYVAHRQLSLGLSAVTDMPRIERASSTRLALPDKCVDLVVTSPPYCTRIDYVMATQSELALLGYDAGKLRSLRSEMIGTPTMLADSIEPVPAWGKAALEFIDEVVSHPSRASSTYYRRYYLQYFAGMNVSLAELARVCKPSSNCVLVVQDSYYKDVHLDLSKAIAEMAASYGWDLLYRLDYHTHKTRAAVNPRSRLYRSHFHATESVLVLQLDT